MRSTLEAFRNGEPQAVHAIYARYRGAVYAVAAMLWDSPEAANNATAGAFEQTWRAALAFGADRELSPWLLGFVVSGSPPAPTDGPDGESSPRDVGFDAAWTLFETRRAVDDLHADERLVLELMYTQGASTEAVAAKIDAPPSAVELIAGRAKHRVGAATGPLEPNRVGEAEQPQLSIRPEIEQLLSQTSAWVQPNDALDEAVLTRMADAVASQPKLPSAPGPDDRRHLVVIAVVAVLFLLAGLVIAVAATVGDDDEGAPRSVSHEPYGWSQV